MSKITPQKRISQFNNKELSNVASQKALDFSEENSRDLFLKDLPEYKLPSTFFADSKVALLCNSLNRSVFQIILIKLDLNYDNRPKLVDTLFLEADQIEREDSLIC
ncbi:hypothetical protein BpHYR1_012852 [Brachionus plicatilis]|uniref:Uncharacterized protein n=1 Tax=Brachionus plicatilis TaxID=10195 RepID=A0A3M7PIF3_BRAPC|nr:hypothetical protein BpHYR1_012852 [Brachionus plicatilis]